MPISLEQPGPVNPAVLQQIGIGQQVAQDAPGFLRILGDATDRRFAQQRDAYQAYVQAMRQQQQQQYEMQAAQQRAQLQAWLQEREVSTAERLRLQQWQHGLDQILTDPNFSDEEREIAVTRYKTKIDPLQMRLQRAQAKQAEELAKQKQLDYSDRWQPELDEQKRPIIGPDGRPRMVYVDPTGKPYWPKDYKLEDEQRRLDLNAKQEEMKQRQVEMRMKSINERRGLEAKSWDQLEQANRTRLEAMIEAAQKAGTDAKNLDREKHAQRASDLQRDFEVNHENDMRRHLRNRTRHMVQLPVLRRMPDGSLSDSESAGLHYAAWLDRVYPSPELPGIDRGSQAQQPGQVPPAAAPQAQPGPAAGVQATRQPEAQPQESQAPVQSPLRQLALAQIAYDTAPKGAKVPKPPREAELADRILHNQHTYGKAYLMPEPKLRAMLEDATELLKVRPDLAAELGPLIQTLQAYISAPKPVEKPREKVHISEIE